MFKRNHKTRITAIILSVIMLLSCTANVFAADGSSGGVSGTVKFIDKAFDLFADALVGSLTKSLLAADNLGLIIKSNRFPTVDEYFAQEHEYFYEGTDGLVQGTGWKLGYESASVIPTAWRVDADGNPDPNGMCLNKAYYFGGYFGSTVNNIYDDERVSLVVLSAGNDANGNGIDDIIILASIDTIGVSNGNVRDIRAAVSKALVEQKGIAADDIVAFEFASTHAHSTIEGLGMSLNTVFTTAMKNHFLFTRERSVEQELIQTICANTAAAAVSAYGKMQKGTLSYFETDNVNDYMKENSVNENPNDTIRDKNEYGAGCQKFFACYYFVGENGEKTMLSNIGLHPTFSGRSSDRVCADVPHYIQKVMGDEGYNFVFLQGSQAAIGLSGNYTKAGYDYAVANTLSYEEWVNRYGKKYADARYNGNDDESGEGEYFSIRATGYSLAHFILDNIDKAEAVSPVYDIKMGEAVIPLDYGIMYIAATGAVFGYNTVRYSDSETGYAIVTEIGYVQLGDDVVMVMLPGEVSPALTFGKDESYTGTDSWEGATSFTGEAWEYDTIANYAKAALGEDKRVIAMGVANDEIGYVTPDTDCAQNFLTKTVFGGMFGSPVDRGDNEELMETSHNAGSALVGAYRDFFTK